MLLSPVLSGARSSLKIYHLEQEASFSSVKHRTVKERIKTKPQTKWKTPFTSHVLSLLFPICDGVCICFCNVIEYVAKWLEEMYLHLYLKQGLNSQRARRHPCYN